MKSRHALVVVVAGILLSGLVANVQAGQIHWRSGTIETSFRGARSVAADIAALVERTVENRVRIVVQFDQPVTPAVRSQLHAAGLTLQTYVGDHAFVARVSPRRLNTEALAEIRSLRVALPIQREWKLHPSLLAGEIPPWAVADPSAAYDPGAEPYVACYVLFHADVDLETEAVSIALGYEANVRSRLHSINGLVLELPREQLDLLADEPVVLYVEPPLPPFSETNNDNRVRTGADIAQEPPYGLDGTGVSVMVYDGGGVLMTHPDFTGRATIRDDAGLSDHGTHVAGTIGGAGIASGGAFRGMAPAVLIESYEFETQGPLQAGFLYTDPGDIEADYSDAFFNHGADVANNSIGTNVAPNGFPCEWTGDYGVTSALIDAIVRGSLGAPVRVVWANGNERGTPRCGDLYATTAPPAGAKNHLTVGALNSNDDSVASFTSWGPVDDGRLKPDIAAPGCQSDDDLGVTSTSSSGAYNTKCGTSMATPTVTGLAALLLQEYRNLFPNALDFRNSTLRALLANTALDVENPGPDYMTGYGSVRVVPAIEQLRSGNFYESELSQGMVHLSLIVVPTGATELRATLAWDDKHSTPLVSPALVNDLDLRVIDPATNVHFPWTLDPANPATPAVRTQPDRLNNIEQVWIESPPPGLYVVEIEGFNVPSGVQTFSLVATPTLIDCTRAGRLEFDRTAYTCESLLIINLNDCDLNTDNTVVETVDITVVSTTEPTGETVVLSETGPETAEFVGTLTLSTTDDADVLWIAEGDTITATYLDADDGLGGTDVLVEVTAGVDCTPPTVSDVAAVDLGPRSAWIEFTTDEPTRASIRYGLTCDDWLGSVETREYVASHSIELAGLVDNTEYQFEVEVSDPAGNITLADPDEDCFHFTTTDIPNYFSEQFFGNFDLQHRAILFIPGNSVDYYDACTYETLALPTDPAGGTLLGLENDNSVARALTDGAQVWLYGAAYDTVQINANGNVTFGTHDSDSSERYEDHFDLPRVSGLFDDLNPGVRGQVYWQQLDDRAVITWLNVTEDDSYNGNTFQIELYFDGRIQLAWLEIAIGDGLVGLSQGLGVPFDFLPSNLSGVDDCGPRPPSAAGDEVFAGQDRSLTISLRALDDGSPADELQYLITSLPMFDLRDAANDHLIQPGDLPYALVDDGSEVVYSSTGFVGDDAFTFVANDGGTPPDGGDSNVATISIHVGPVLSVPFLDSFPTTVFDPGKWFDATYTTIDGAGLTIPSPPYAVRLNGHPVGSDQVTSHLMGLSSVDAVRLRYAWQRTGGGESPDSGENLVVEFFNDTGTWETLREYAGDGADMTAFQQENFVLPASALHDSFRLRFQVTGSPDDTEFYDDWFVDDVSLTYADAPYAQSVRVTVNVDGVRDIALPAIDPDGDPLDFIITSLPLHGTMTDPAGGVIITGDLPYTLLAQGNTVRFAPTPGYQGGDAFSFLATDGAHDSNVATVTLAIEPVLTLPFFEPFATDTLDAQRWALSPGTTIDEDGLNEPSAPYAARLNAVPYRGDTLRTYTLDLSTVAPVRLDYAWQRTGDGDSPETGEDLFVEMLDASGIWQIVGRHEGAGEDMETFEQAIILLPEWALHADFRLRFRSTSESSSGDDWFVDDIHLFVPTVPEAFDQDLQLTKFSFAELALAAVDPNGDPLDLVILTLPQTGALIDVGADYEITSTDLPYTLADRGNAVDYYPPLGFTGHVSFTFDANDGEFTSNTATVALTIASPRSQYTFPLDVDPGWSREGEWAFGVPLGQYGDPIAGHTGGTIYGYDLAGRYDNNIPPHYLTTSAIDCSRLTNVELQFYRWLGVEEAWFDHATIEVSSDGVDFSLVWENGFDPINDDAWSLYTYPLGPTADRQPTVFVRWGMGPTDGGVTYQGWNIDDVTIIGDLQPTGGDIDHDGSIGAADRRGLLACIFGPDTLPEPPSPMTPADCLGAYDFDGDDDVDCDDWDALVDLWTGPPATPPSIAACPALGDLNCDGTVDFDDIDPFVLALTGESTYLAAFPDCRWLNADCNNDDFVNFDDIDAFVAILSSR